jgi:FtsP/CotA-like multicopper oxidase with cupredoxin domain
MVASGKSVEIDVTAPDAGTFWFRASPQQRALYGALIVDDERELQRADRDAVLLLDEWRLRDDGRVDEASGAPTLTVNNLATPDIETNSNERVRLRFINAGTRIFNLRIERHDVRVMAIDGQPAQPFLARDGRIALAPGNRVDVFIDMGLPPRSSATIFADDADREVPLARLVYGAATARAEPLPPPPPLPANPLPEKLDLAGSLKTEIRIEALQGWSAGSLSSGGPPLFTVRRGRAVTLALVNRSATPRVLHVHGHAVRLLDRLDDGWKPYWLDTVLVEANATARIAFLPDNPGQWLLESGVLNERGDTLFGRFDVT